MAYRCCVDAVSNASDDSAHEHLSKAVGSNLQYGAN